MMYNQQEAIWYDDPHNQNRITDSHNRTCSLLLIVYPIKYMTSFTYACSFPFKLIWLQYSFVVRRVRSLLIVVFACIQNSAVLQIISFANTLYMVYVVHVVISFRYMYRVSKLDMHLLKLVRKHFSI